MYWLHTHCRKSSSFSLYFHLHESCTLTLGLNPFSLYLYECPAQVRMFKELCLTKLILKQGGAMAPTNAQRYRPVGHGSSEQATGRRSRFGTATTPTFGLTPPGSRSGTPPPRSSTRPARSPSSRRRSRDDRSESHDRARSREDRQRERDATPDEQPMPSRWGA